MAEIILTDHVKWRLIERGIDVHEAKMIAKNGMITKSGLGGKIAKVGESYNGKMLVVIFSQSGNKIVLVTAYYED